MLHLYAEFFEIFTHSYYVAIQLSLGEEENISVEQSSAYTLSVTASTHQKGESYQSFFLFIALA